MFEGPKTYQWHSLSPTTILGTLIVFDGEMIPAILTIISPSLSGKAESQTILAGICILLDLLLGSCLNFPITSNTMVEYTPYNALNFSTWDTIHWKR